MKTITMYELLGLIKEGKAPKKIKYNDYIYTVGRNTRKHFIDYYSEEDEWCFNYYVKYENLNDTVEILEEEKKIPEKIKDKYCSQISKVELAQKYNEIIDYLEYLKSKGDK